MTIGEIKEKIKTNTKIPADMKEQIIGKIPYLKMPQLEKLAALLSYEEEQDVILGKLSGAFSAMNNYAAKQGVKAVYTKRETAQSQADTLQQENLLKELDNL